MGPWHNTKKFIVTGTIWGKGSERHKVAVVGDTMGDPCNDTTGPSIHILIKLLGVSDLI